jgi:uncharacterized protein
MMNHPNLEQARQYALERLERELSPAMTYHSLEHTRDEVVPAAEELAAAEGVTGDDLIMLQTAAYFHDLGYIERTQGHEEVSARIAAEVLPRFGYTDEQIQAIQHMIMATKLPQCPITLLEEILADADLSVLGKEDYLDRNLALRAEFSTNGNQPSDEGWYARQLKFLRDHQYFTHAAHVLRDAQKQKNIALVTKLLAESQSQTT